MVQYPSTNVLQGISTYHNHSAMMRLDFHVGSCLGSSHQDNLESLAYSFLWFGDKDKLLKGRVDIIPTPQSVLEGSYVSTVNADYEEMLMI